MTIGWPTTEPRPLWSKRGGNSHQGRYRRKSNPTHALSSNRLALPQTCHPARYGSGVGSALLFDGTFNASSPVKVMNSTGNPASADGRRLRPPVAVVIGCFNQAAFVESAIRSVASQSYPDFDCVVVDDRSTDKSADLITRCLTALGDSRFRFVVKETNDGQMSTMLTGFDLSTAPFVCFLDGDDFWDPGFLERHISAHLNRGGMAAVSSSDINIVDVNGVAISGGHPSFRRSDPRLRSKMRKLVRVVGEGADTLVFVERGAARWLWSATSGMMFRRSVVEAVRPPDPKRIPICADIYLARAAHFLGGTVRLERVLGSYRMHGANAWANGQLLGDGTPLGVTPVGDVRDHTPRVG